MQINSLVLRAAIIHLIFNFSRRIQVYLQHLQSRFACKKEKIGVLNPNRIFQSLFFYWRDFFCQY